MCVLLACCVPSLLVEVEKFKTMASTSVTAKEDVEAKYEVATNARAVAEAKVEEMLGRLSALEEAHKSLDKLFQVCVCVCVGPVCALA
jgi:hypothetical protein